MKVFKIIPVLLLAFCMGCSSGDDVTGPQVGGPTEGTDPDPDPTTPPTDNSDPFTYSLVP